MAIPKEFPSPHNSGEKEEHKARKHRSKSCESLEVQISRPDPIAFGSDCAETAGSAEPPCSVAYCSRSSAAGKEGPCSHENAKLIIILHFCMHRVPTGFLGRKQSVFNIVDDFLARVEIPDRPTDRYGVAANATSAGSI
jgi:hypothetical protein